MRENKKVGTVKNTYSRKNGWVPFYSGSGLYFPVYIFRPGLYLDPVYMWISVTYSNGWDQRRIKKQEGGRKRQAVISVE